MEREELQRLAAAGESETVEFKKSTGLLTRAGETLCAFLNGRGGRLFFGITPEGQVVGQHVSDNTQRDLAALLTRFEPAPPIEISRIPLANGLAVLLLEAMPSPQGAPFLFQGRPYQRVGSTTSIMPQARYEALLLERAHQRARWETGRAAGLTPEQLDRDEIFRTVRLGIEKGRLPESTGSDLLDILDRLGLRADGQLLNAAVVLFGKALLPACPQCALRLARFRGVDKSVFMDERQLQGHAFRLLDEALAFLHRHLPISGRFEPGRLERIDEPLFPIPALREALVNALCHRDYAIVGGAVNVAIFDDRVEIWSSGKLPFGLQPEALKREHNSQPRNPLITGVLYRRGLIEQWGRGTQKIVELCTRAGHPEPTFDEVAGSVVVTFRPASGNIAVPKVTGEVTPEVAPQVTPEVGRLLPVCVQPQTRKELQRSLHLSDEKSFRRTCLVPALQAGLIEMTLPEKPNSRFQKYRLTAKGRAWLATHGRASG